MAEPAPKQCRSCGAPVLWVYTAATGKRMPIDAKPVGDGNLIVCRRGRGGVLAGTDVRVKKGDLVAEAYKDEPLYAGRNRYVSHFATCRQAKNWRKPR